MTTHTDYFGNAVTFFAMQGAHKRLTVRARSRVDPARPRTCRRRRTRRRGRPSPTARRCRSRRSSFCSTAAPASGERRAGGVRARVLSAGPAAARGGRRSDPTHPRGFTFDPRGDDRRDAAGGRLHVAARRLSGFRAAGDRVPARRSGCRPDTSAGISKPCRRRAARACSAPTRRTPGWRSTVRAPAGFTSIPRTTCCHRARTSRWPGVATTTTSARSTA